MNDEIDERLATPAEALAYQRAADAARRPNEAPTAPYVRGEVAAHSYITRFTTFGAQRVDVSGDAPGSE